MIKRILLVFALVAALGGCSHYGGYGYHERPGYQGNHGYYGAGYCSGYDNWGGRGYCW